MRNNLFCTLTAVLVAFMGVSCLNTSGLDMQQGDHIDVATIVDGSYNTPYYVEFDNGEKASVASNRVGSSITFPTKPEILKGEVRKIVEYYLDGTPLEGFEKSITITNMLNIIFKCIIKYIFNTFFIQRCSLCNFHLFCWS